MMFPQLFSRRTLPADAKPDPRGMSPYSFEIVQLLESRYALPPGAIGAEIGAGKGRLAELFLKHGYSLLATEDDATDRAVCERLKERFPALRVVSGTATATNLPNGSVDFVLSERALFESDQDAVKCEFRRILRPGGAVMIITDNRVYAGGRQTEEYTEILRRYCPKFREKVLPYDIPAAVAHFFSGVEVYEDAFVGTHVLSLDFLLAQTRALEIYPPSGDPGRRLLDAEMTKFFKRWQVDGKLLEPVVCRVACGRFEQLPQREEAADQLMTSREAAFASR